MKMNRRSLIFISGLVWLGVGIFLLSLGVSFLLQAAFSPPFLVRFLGRVTPNPQHAIVILLTFALFIGHLKGKVVLSKSAKKQIGRLYALPEPIALKQIYSLGYYMLLAGMVLLGLLMRFCPNDLRGLVDVAIGFALTRGSLGYFREAFFYNKGQTLS